MGTCRNLLRSLTKTRSDSNSAVTSALHLRTSHGLLARPAVVTSSWQLLAAFLRPRRDLSDEIPAPT